MAQAKVSPWGFVGMGGMACVLFLNLGTANVAPWWVTVLFLLLWLVLFLLAMRWFVPQPTWVPWLPLGAFVVWLPTIVLGTRNLGWGELSLAQPTGSTRSTESRRRLPLDVVTIRSSLGNRADRPQPAVLAQRRRSTHPRERARGVEAHEHHALLP